MKFIAQQFLQKWYQLNKRQKTVTVHVFVYLSVIMTIVVIYTTKTITSSQQQRHRCNYVGIEMTDTGTGLGNHLFFYTIVSYVASLTGRRPCIYTKSTNTLLDKVFDVDIERIDIKTLACPLYNFTQQKFGIYDIRVQSLIYRKDNESLLLKGFFQS